ncbi:hypothetical protein GTR04_2747 [Trichophyton interdigitale]|uniref:Uncharacterized protein n=1 Tax=Trichophyton interdigitale TaxID=101480 RepID=A0A9P4YLY3_9EURO|nr:hypothetical protein GY631_2568 [Trichophyton interdigitale]KAF3899579.1 hypothetical protein GY632_1206 [Trichophyton interdigitale]KAG8209889.1 hypothetical protein GTR04_2747 [Trichophyton interdigitale]
MSADLFAAFGQPDSASQPTTASNNANLSTTGPVKGQPGALLDTDVDPRDATAPQTSIFESWQPPALERASSDAEVLFDATTEPPPGSNDEDADDDEWGEFESAEQLPVAQQEGSLGLQHQVIDISSSSGNSATPRKPSFHQAAKSQPQPENVIDLLSIDDDPARTTTGYSTGDRPVRYQIGQTSGEEVLVVAPPGKNKNKEIEIEEGDDDDWGEFIDGAEDAGTKAQQQQQQQQQQQPIPTTSSLGRAQVTAASPGTSLNMGKPATRKAETSTSSVRPTNIPPPSILLPLFPPLLEESRQKAAGYAKRKGDGSSPLPDGEFANQLVSDIRTMAHVVSGRHLRWKRDQILSQSTKIGPARSGRSGGMKLSSVNKSENVKEEKEAVEVVEAWKRCSGLLNSVVTSRGRNPMPALSLSMQVRTATADEGALKSAHACALCGLKREERVARVDDGVSDSFGEWWLDHWGHADCEAFWKSNAAKLDHR